MSSPVIPLDFTFSVRRALLWTRNLLWSQARTMGLVAGVLAGSYWILYLLVLWGTGSRGVPPEGLLGIMIVGLGVVMSSHGFRDLHRPHKTAAWLLLPASVLEKFVGTVALIAAILVVFPVFQVLIDLVAQGLGWIILGRSQPPFHPTDPRFLETFGSVFAVSPVFLFGSVFFRKGQLLKTLLAVLAAALVLFLFVLGLTFLCFGDFSGPFTSIHLSEGMMTWGVHRYRLDAPVLQILGGFVRGFGDLLLWVVTPVFFLIATFLRLTEIEARDGVS